MDCNALSLIDSVKKAKRSYRLKAQGKQPWWDFNRPSSITEVALARLMNDKIIIYIIYWCLVSQNFSMVLGSHGTFGRCKVAKAWVRVRVCLCRSRMYFGFWVGGGESVGNVSTFFSIISVKHCFITRLASYPGCSSWRKKKWAWVGGYCLLGFSMMTVKRKLIRS